MKPPERSQWCRSGFFIVNFKHISHLSLVLLLLTLNRKISAEIFLLSWNTDKKSIANEKFCLVISGVSLFFFKNEITIQLEFELDELKNSKICKICDGGFVLDQMICGPQQTKCFTKLWFSSIFFLFQILLKHRFTIKIAVR